ncbi:serine protease [Verrucomicrobia bacterium S94]|nr:serine protease [Verrucomicrobia bacterium S94]
MSKRLLLLLLLLAAGFTVRAGEVEDALKTVEAPGGEYVRMPARYIFRHLEKTARNSGIPVLGGFVIEPRLEGVDQQKINVSFGGMNVLQALHTMAEATGSLLVFENNAAVFADARLIEVKTEDVPAGPVVEERKTDSEVAFSDVDSALVFVETGSARGSAFIAEQDGKTYLFSNQHNFTGATQLELISMHQGRIRFGSFEFSRSRDLVRFELSRETVEGLGVLKLSEKNPYIGQKIVVYGNSAGGNVATELRGKVLGVGPRDIEVDAEIVSGNSGSPIIDEQGSVVGVATYVAFQLKSDGKDLHNEIFRGTRFRKARRYGVRIPSDGWVKVDIRQFLNQTYVQEDLKNYLDVLYTLEQFWNGNDDFEEAAGLILSSYSTLSTRVNPPYEFHAPGVEEQVRMLVKAFKRNYEEFVGVVADMDMDRRELARLTNPNNRLSVSKVEQLDYHIRTTLLAQARQKYEEIGRYQWMSEYLEESAAPLEQLAGELIRVLDQEQGFRERIEAVM